MESSFKFKGNDYVYFPEGVKFYSLYRTTRKINSFSELEYIAEKFIYLNPDFDVEVAKSLFALISDRGSGHIIRTYGSSRVENMVERVFAAKKQPYCPRLRKVIFNPFKMMSRSEKMKIVGSLIGTKEKPTEEQIDSTIEELWLDKEKITITKVAEKLNKTRYLVRWYFDKEKLKSIRNFNSEIHETNQISKAIEAIDILTDNGSSLKMRELKKLTSIRDYALLKQAVISYQKRL